MKIGITCYPTYGGSGVIATELGKELAAKGHQVHFISYALPFRLEQYEGNLFFHEVELLDYPVFDHPPYTVALAAKMAEVAREAGLEILHVHYAIPHAVSAYLAKQILGSKLPKVITTLHGTDILLVGRNPSFHDITRHVIENSDAATCVSHFLQKETEGLFQINQNLTVIPNFVNTSLFVPGKGLRKRFAPGGERIFMHLSNFRPLKRVEDVIRVFALVAKDVPSRLLMVGDGSQMPLARQLTEDLKVYDKVIFLSRQREVASLLATADIFLVTSEMESFGLAALEAMSCGVPVIGTRCGGLQEVVKEGLTGFLSAVGDIEDMARNCLRLLSDEKLYLEMRRAARSRAVELFDANVVVPLYEQCYQRVLGMD